MSKQQSYYISLTSDARAAINVDVASKVEMQKAKPLFSNLVSKCQVSLENSSTPQEFFVELRKRLEKFSEFTDFFDTTAVSMATAITQMRFHSVLVDHWDEQYAKIVCTREGEDTGITYDIPPPSILFHLQSKKAAKKSGSMMSFRYGTVGTVDFSYGFTNEDSVELEKLRDKVPEDAIKGAVSTMMEDVEKLHRNAMNKVLVDCGVLPMSEDEIQMEKEENGSVMTVKHLGVSSNKTVFRQKMRDLIDRLDIKPTDSPDDILKALIEDPEGRRELLEDFKKYRVGQEADDWQESYIKEYKRLMPKPGEFVAEA
jgi:hypothetical protein